MLLADNLIIFASIVEAGSFTRAAQLTGVPKSTLSRRLAELENELGGQLLQRTTRQLVLTELGISILEHARHLQEQTMAAKALAQNRQIEPQGTLRVSLPPEFHELSIPSVVTQYQEEYPNVSLSLDFSARRVDLLAERFDLAVRVASRLPEDASLRFNQIASLKNSLYASAKYLEKYGMPTKVQDLVNHVGLMLVTGSGETQPWYLSKGKTNWQGQPGKVISANSMGLQRELATNGVGIVGLSWFLAKQLVMENKLQPVLPKWQLPTVGVWCVTPGRRLLPQRTLAFMAILKSAVSTKLLN